MISGQRFGAIAAWASRHARAILVLSAIVAIAAALAATRLPTDAGTDTLVDDDSASFAATEQVRRLFGEDPIVIVADGDLRKLVLTDNLGRLLRLEGCLSGRIPEKVTPLPGACTELAELQPAKLVSGPATFLNQAVIGIEQALGGQLRAYQAQVRAAALAAVQAVAADGGSRAEQIAAARAAEQAVSAQFQAQLLQVMNEYGITRLPSIADPLFVSAVVFDSRQPPGTPKARLSYLFPNANSAQIIVRLRPNLSDAERSRALDLIRQAVADETPREECLFRNRPDPCFKLHDADYLLSGAPVVVDGLAGILKSSLIVLLAVALVVMALTLLAVFRSRLRLLPLALAVSAAAITYGAVGLIGGSLTMASIAVLPVLIGLAVDYAIQLQARFDEAVRDGARGAEAARGAAAAAGPVVATACLATAAGFAALLLSPVPMVRSFGLMLIAGIAIALLLAFTVGFAALSLRRGSPGAPARLATRAGSRLDSLRDSAAAAISRLSSNALAVAISSPGRVFAVALALAACGWAAGTRTELVSDIRQLVPQDLEEVRDLEEVQDVTGVSGEVDVSVQAPDLTDPAVITWMDEFKDRVLAANGFDGEFPSCEKAEICPGPALTDFINTSQGEVTSERVNGLIDSLPEYDLRGVISFDAETGEIGHTANIAFGIRVMPLDRQQELIESIRSQIDPPGPGNGPPPGVDVRMAGLPVLAAESNDALSESRYWLTLAGLLAVALTLLAVYRSFSRALVPLVPIVLATGWSSLVLAAMDIPLNPMSATLGALVIAISTEFSVILSARYREEREGGLSVGEALRRSYARTGAAVVASGVTAIAGFAALIASDIRMLRDFGFVTVVDLSVALIGVMLVLPAVLVWAEAGVGLRRIPLPRRLAALAKR